MLANDGKDVTIYFDGLLVHAGWQGGIKTLGEALGDEDLRGYGRDVRGAGLQGLEDEEAV